MGVAITYAVRTYADTDTTLSRKAVAWPPTEAVGKKSTQAQLSPELRHDTAIGFQAWVDFPTDLQDGLLHEDTQEAIKTVVDWLEAAIVSRHEKAGPDVAKALQDWRAWVGKAPVASDELTEAGVDQRSYDDDANLQVPVTRCAVIAWARLEDPKTGCVGAMLRLAVGPDRFGLRVEGRSAHTKGDVSRPYEPMMLSLFNARRALGRSVDQLRGLVDGYVKSVRSTIKAADLETAKVAQHMSRSGELLACATALEHRNEDLRRILSRTESGSAGTAFVSDLDDEDELRGFAQQLRLIRDELAEAPQFLLTASSAVLAAETHNQAKETLNLTRLAAALILPTLIAGALGANVLPWDKANAWAPAGMLAMMVGAGVAAYFTVGAKNVWAITSGTLIAIAGFLSLLHGTETRTDEPQPVIEVGDQRGP